MRRSWLPVIWALAICLPAIGATRAGAPGDEDLWSGSWKIVGMAPSAQTQSIWAGSNFTMTFEAEMSGGDDAKGQVSGRACNNFFGDFEVAAQKVRVSVLGTTRMACAGVVGHMENELLDLLATGSAAFTWDGETLRLTYGEERYIRLRPSIP